ncbi:hypothetical protein F5B20DRAFT_52505 [Whalleya microplaca]|nr:hypothetical protein F5B20DRAFT_52505 [Whalleya microplaca]
MSNTQSPPSPGKAPRSQSMSFWRRQTNNSTFSAAQSHRSSRSPSFPILARNEREAAKPKRYQEKYPAYKNLLWETLHQFLLTKWPDEKFVGTIRGDNWIFETPAPLTDADRQEIAKRRDSNAILGQRDSVSPEP